MIQALSVDSLAFIARGNKKNQEEPMEEIFELNSLLKGGDKEKEELERKRLSLQTAIRQQESRLLHEYEEVGKIERDLEDFDQSLSEICDVLDAGATYASLKTEAEAFKTSCEGILAKRQALCENIDKLKSMYEKVSSEALEVESKPSLASLRRTVSELREELERLKESTSISFQNASKLREEKQTLQEQYQRLAIQLEELLAEKEHLVAHTVEVKHQATVAELALFRANETLDGILKRGQSDFSLYQLKINSLDAEVENLEEDTANRSNDLNDEVQNINQLEKCRDSLLVSVAQKETEFRRLQILSEQHKQEISRLEGNVHLGQSQLHLIADELEMVKTQYASMRSYNFLEKLELLSIETEAIRSLVVNTREATQQVLQEIRHPEQSTDLSRLLERLQDNLSRKELLLAEISQLKKQIVSVREGTQHKLQWIEMYPTDYEVLRREISQRKKDVQQDVQEIQHTVSNHADINELVHYINEKIQGAKYLQDEVEYSINTVRNIEASLLKLSNELLAKRKQLQQNDTMHQQHLRSLLKHRMQAHLHEKQVQHQTDIQYLEQELMDEDRAFQAKVLRSEAQLAAKKEALLKELQLLRRNTAASGLVSLAPQPLAPAVIASKPVTAPEEIKEARRGKAAEKSSHSTVATRGTKRPLQTSSNTRGPVAKDPSQVMDGPENRPNASKEAANTNAKKPTKQARMRF